MSIPLGSSEAVEPNLTARVNIPGYPERTADDLVPAYVEWLRTKDPSADWAWEAPHDGIWFAFEPSDALSLLVRIAAELDGDAAALNLLGAGPLEDLLGGDPSTMERALEEARASRSFRVAVASVAGVKHGEPGHERLRDAVAHELCGTEGQGAPPAG